ncbi:hypothetical protein [Tolypothrix sp. VBCCA 56010]|uniref:hypothetical protein n=1 Tax=Tolypothrix sp. VBCCA 56010 TaxID=3137731 RepID=UPI003D7E8B11
MSEKKERKHLMLHNKRTWTINEVSSPEQLAEKLTAHTWTGCTGFKLGNLLFLNDATSGDGAQEYAVVALYTNNDFLQIESITFSWCSYEQALAYIKNLHNTNFCILEGSRHPDWGITFNVSPQIEPLSGVGMNPDKNGQPSTKSSLKTMISEHFEAVLDDMRLEPNRSTASKCQGCPFLSRKNEAASLLFVRLI